MLDDKHRAGLGDHPGLYGALEAERAAQEGVLQMIEGQDAAMWLLTVGNVDSICAAVLDNRWLSPSSMSWMHADCTWDLFALFRRQHETGIPLFAAIHVTVKW